MQVLGLFERDGWRSDAPLHVCQPQKVWLAYRTKLEVRPEQLIAKIHHQQQLQTQPNPSSIVLELLHTTPAIEMPSEAENEPAAAPVAVFKRRGAKGKANIRKRPATPPPANSDSDSDYSSSEDETGHRVKRRKKTATVTATSKDHVTRDRDLAATTFAADRNAAMSTGNDATKSSNWFDEGSKDELSAKNLLGSTRSGAKTQDAAPDGTYKGLANQTSFIQKRTDAPSRTVGPVKAPTNIRTITITDYAPDVCKDYKQTGFVSCPSPLSRWKQRETALKLDEPLLTLILPPVWLRKLLKIPPKTIHVGLELTHPCSGRQLQILARSRERTGWLAARQGVGERLQRQEEHGRHGRRRRKPDGQGRRRR